MPEVDPSSRAQRAACAPEAPDLEGDAAATLPRLQQARWRLTRGRAIGLVLLVGLYLAIYLPHLTTVPDVYSDDFILLQAAASFADHGTLTFSINSSPFRDPAVLGSAETNRALLEEGYFVLLGLLFKGVGASITTARLFSCLSGLLYLVVMYLGFAPLAGTLPAWGACVLTLLETNFWADARTVRPDLPTALMCALGMLLAQWPPPRRRATSVLLALLAGLCFGVGTTMHPNWTLYVLPALVVLYGDVLRGGVSGAATCRLRALALVGGVMVLAVPYGLDLWWHREEVARTFAVHAQHTAILEKGTRVDDSPRLHWLISNILAEPQRFVGVVGHDRNYQTRTFMRTWGLLAVLWLAVRALMDRLRRPVPVEPAPHGRVLLMLGLMVTVMAATVTYKVPLYMVHVYPWMHLAACLLVADIGSALAWGKRTLLARLQPATISSETQRPLAPQGGVAGLLGRLPLPGLLALALIYYVVVTGRSYQRFYRGFDRAGVAGYEALTTALARHLPADALLFSSPNGWPVARKAGATLISNQMYPYQQVELPLFPWRYQADGTHLVSYRLDVPRMEHVVAASRRRVFYLADEWDWAWNGFGPVARSYGQSYAQLQQALAEHFNLVAEVVSGPRGQMRLYEYRRQGQEPATAAPLYLEGASVPGTPTSIFTMDDLRRVLHVPHGALALPAGDQPVPLCTQAAVPGRLYRVTLRVRAPEAGGVLPIVLGWSSEPWHVVRVLASPWPITYTWYYRAERDEVRFALQPTSREHGVVIEDCRIERF